MQNIIDYFRGASVTVQALGVTAGGLIGVFATLFMFFLIIWVSDKLGKKK